MAGKKKNIKSTSEIEACIHSIASIDDDILRLINQRRELTINMGALKKKNLETLLQSNDEKSIKRLSVLNSGPLDPKKMQILFRNIFSISQEVVKPRRISYLGPEATFTHIAAMNHFGDSSSFFPQPDIRDVFHEVEKERCDFGVVPVENSIEGSVNYTLDLFFESNLKICAEKYLTVSHDLLSKSKKPDDIHVIFSHPQPIAQCRGWLRKNLPNAKIEECKSTSFAAQKVVDIHDAAAIASSEAARIYNLNVIASRIEDYPNNTTRFLIIGKNETSRTGDDKTSIMFAAAHVPGSLYKTLEPIAKAGINMLKLESRPSKHENWNYFFFVDLEGHIADRKIQDTISRMKELCLFLKILGSYPKSMDR